MRPAHPCDELQIAFTAECLDHIVALIKDKGDVDLETLTQRRSYGGGPDGVWTNGSAGLVGRVMSEQSCDIEDAIPKKRFTTLAQFFKNQATVPLADDAGEKADGEENADK